MKPLISIIVVNYNVKALLLKCFETVFNDIADAQVILVDNNSTDGSVEATSLLFPQIEIIANNYNAGFPKANNQGIALAKADFVLLLNPDTEVTDNAISKWLRYLIEHPNIKLSAPCLLNTDRTVQFSIQRFISVKEILAEVFFLHNFLKRKESYFNQPITQPIVVEAASGAALMIPRETLALIGTLDEDMFWTEDMEYCYRAKQNGIDTYYLPEFKILHHIGQSGKKNMNVMLSNQIVTKINFFKKNHSALSLYTVTAARWLHVISRIALFSILAIAGTQYRTKAKAYIYTLKRLVRHDY